MNLDINLLKNNIATTGGGICIKNNSVTKIENNIITRNDSYYPNDSSITQEGSMGGGIAVIYSQAEIINDSINHNGAYGSDKGDGPGSAFGGGIFVVASNCIINKCTIRDTSVYF